jgi:hypothetical protein
MTDVTQKLPTMLFQLGTVDDVIGEFESSKLVDEISFVIPPMKMFGVACPNPAVRIEHKLSYPAIYVSVVNDMKVIGGGAFPIISGKAIQHQNFNAERWQIREQGMFLCVIGGNKIFYSGLEGSYGIDRPVISLSGNGSTNYAHWMTEFLPQVVLLLLADADLSEFKLLVDEGVFPSMLDALKLLGIRDDQIILLPPWSFNEFPEAFWVSPVANVIFQRPNSWEKEHRGRLAEPGDAVFHPEVIKAVRDVYRQLVITDNSDAPEKIFITRTPGRKGDQRMVINEAAISRQLENMGFVSVDPSNLSFVEQVNLFSRAKYIVAASGAALVNMMWAPQGARIIVLINDASPVNYWYFGNIAFALGHRLSHVLGEIIDTGNFSDIVHADFLIDPQAVIDALNDENVEEQFC